MTALIREMVENRCQNHSKIDAKMYQNRLQKKAKRKNTKSVKTNDPPSFLLDFSKLRESKNQENLVKDALENDLKFKCDSELDFSRILVDFGAILGAKIGPKWKKNVIKKRCDFKTKL